MVDEYDPFIRAQIALADSADRNIRAEQDDADWFVAVLAKIVRRLAAEDHAKRGGPD